MNLVRVALCALAPLALLSGCGGGSPDGGLEETPGGSADTAALPAEVPLEDTFRTLEFVAPAYRPHRERGVGVVYPSAHLDVSPPRPDTVEIRTRPEPEAPVVARLVRSDLAVYQMQVRTDVAESGGLEWGYEDIGLPMIEAPGTLGAQADWLRVYYGTSSAGDTLDGWVRNDTARVSHFLWSDRLPESPLFFLDPDSIQLHESVDGPPVTVQLTPSDGTDRYDYILHSLETRGPWMRVEVVSPSDYCADPPRLRRDTVWIRYLGAESRPRVWYYTRGC
jgi:hypothetical protein